MFSRPRNGETTRHLFVGNCGPAVGLGEQNCLSFLPEAGHPQVIIPNAQASHIFVTFDDVATAEKALKVLKQLPSVATFGRSLVVHYAALKGPDPKPAYGAYIRAEDCGVPGLSLIEDFVDPTEEEEILREVGAGDWELLARRRVRHFGYKFEYEARNVDVSKPIEPMPALVQSLMQRMRAMPGMPALDQLTVNDYPLGVGLSPHIDTHSAFQGAICSLSLAGPTVIEFRRDGVHRALRLPARSLLIMADEARLAWQHYIPHRKSDIVNSIIIPRGHRISLTFRQVWGQPCRCRFPECCDSQQGQLPPTRRALLQGVTFTSQGSVGDVPAPTSIDHSSKPASDCQGTFQQQCAFVQGSSPTQRGPGSASSSSIAQSSDAESLASQQQPLQPRDDSSAAPVGTHASVRQSSDAESLASQQHLSQPGDDSSAAPVSTSGSSPLHGAHQCEPGSPRSLPAGAGCSHRSHQELEGTFVTSMYDAIAPHFSATRFAVWPRVKSFIESLPAGTIVADVGCGNGKYFGVRHDIMVLGSDCSIGLAKVAARRLDPPHASQAARVSLRADVALADGFRLPMRDAACDAVLCIAVLHHISNVPRRLAMLRQLLRVMRPGGRAYVSVWATLQEDPAKTLAKWEPMQASPDPTPTQTSTESAQVVEIPDPPDWAKPSPSEACSAGTHAPQPEDLDVTAAQLQGVRFDEKKQTLVFRRYYHLFEEAELADLVGQVEGAQVEDCFYDKSNWCVVMRKALSEP
ncbi:hypothetical protein WJX84_002914 [Apatococcus fuscideae]|uniref:Fe2OG dioxygenase domain-containing protein n=1 Tax=Apatococcus fuscideae TaxID=2026836 RepID=A0AAW1TFC5_9CHLO